jgi:hypothetical protein
MGRPIDCPEFHFSANGAIPFSPGQRPGNGGHQPIGTPKHIGNGAHQPIGIPRHSTPKGELKSSVNIQQNDDFGEVGERSTAVFWGHITKSICIEQIIFLAPCP